MGIQKYYHQAMGTMIVLILPMQHSLGDVDAVFSIFDKQEKKFSRFNKNSLLSKLNTQKYIEGDKEFFEVTQAAHQYYETTNGAFNPLLSARDLGYTKDFNSEKDKQKKDTPVLERPEHIEHNYNFDEVIFDETNYSIQLKSNQELDLGGIVKGWTVDQAAKFLKEKYDNFLINAGGDIYAHGKQEPDKKWCVGLEGTKKVFLLENQAIATSGNIKRKWEDEEGHMHHHVVNNETHESSNTPYKTVSVIGNTCTECDVLATTAFALENEGEAFLQSQNKQYYLLES